MSPTNRVRLTLSVVVGTAVGVASGWLIFAFLIRAPQQMSWIVVLVVGALLALPLVTLGSVRLIASGRRQTADRESQPLTIFIRLVAAVAVIAGVMLMIASLLRLDSITNEHALHNVTRSGLVVLSILLVLLGGLGSGFYALARAEAFRTRSQAEAFRRGYQRGASRILTGIIFLVVFFDAGLVVTVETKKSLVSTVPAPPLGFLLSFVVVAVVWILFAVAVLRELVTLQLAAGILIIGAVPVLSLVLISPSTLWWPIAYIIFGVYAAASASILAFPLFGRWLL